MKTKKTLAVLLAVMMILSSVPMFAFAAELITPQIIVIPTATEIANPGDRIRTSTLSGGVAIDPTTGVELEGVWSWTSTGTKITESGYYGAYFQAIEYEKYARVTFNVYVRIAGDTTEEELVVSGAVTSWPTIACPEWTPGMTVADLTLTGGEATVKGTFAITTAETTVLKPNEDNSIQIAFTPADSEVIMTGATTKTIQITPTFTVKDITVTVDPDFVCTYEYGTKHLGKLSGASAFGITTDVPSDIKVNVFVSSAVDKDGNPVGTQDVYLTPGEYTARIAVSTSPVKVSGVGDVQLYNSPIFIDNIPIVITKQTSAKAFGNLKITGTDEDEDQSTATINYNFYDAEGVDGHCVLKVNGETVLDNIAPTDTTIYSTYTFTTNTSGKFTATLEYIPAETDYVEFETTVLSQEFELEVLKSEDPIIPGGDDNDNDDNDNPDLDIDWGDLTEGDSDNPIVNIFNNILAWFRNIIETIKNFFRGIGDRT